MLCLFLVSRVHDIIPPCIFAGIEVCMALLVAYVAASLGAVMAQSVLHLLMAFVELPPRSAGCYGFWEGQVKESCFGPDSRMVCFPGNPTRGCVNVTESTNEHFYHTTMGLSTGDITEQVGVLPEVATCLAIGWALVWSALRWRSRTVAQLLPVALIAFLAMGTAWLTGAATGLKFMFAPRLDTLFNPALWARATEQVLLVLGLAHGPGLVHGSYCRELSDVHKVVAMVLALSLGTGVIYALIVFSSLGSLSWELGTPVDRVLHAGQGTTFITMNSYSVHWLYSAAFFLFVVVLGANSQAALVETVLTHWGDTFPAMGAYRPTMVVAHCVAGFVGGLPLVSRQAGLQLLSLLDTQVIGPLLTFTALCEVLGITWLYGMEHLRLDVLLMHGEPWPSLLEVSWTWLLPAVLSCALVGSLLTTSCAGSASAPTDVTDACLGGWVLVAVGVAQVPLWAAGYAISGRRSLSRCVIPPSLTELHPRSSSDAARPSPHHP
ncbi:sodium- and chloride-dependent GABA transporter 2-like [Haemaphysalis longicornis]